MGGIGKKMCPWGRPCSKVLLQRLSEWSECIMSMWECAGATVGVFRFGFCVSFKLILPSWLRSILSS